jgi:hypothetical protein
MAGTNGRTSEDVQQTGTYVPECCNVEIYFEEGMTFQRCPKCESLTLWEFVELTEKAA